MQAGTDAASYPELLCEVLQARRRIVDRNFRHRLALAGSMLVRPCNVRGAQPACRRMLEILAVGGNHHALAGRKIEGRAGGEIDARLGL